MSKAARGWKAALLILLAVPFLLASGCPQGTGINPVAVIFGHFWDGVIKSPFGLPGTIGGPFTTNETVKMYGVFGPGTTPADKSKYYFGFYSQYLEIRNAALNPKDPSDYGYGDVGKKPDGSHEVFVSVPCEVYDKLSMGTGFSSRKCEVRLYHMPGDKPHRFELRVLMPDPKDNYVIVGTAKEPKGTIYFTY